MKQHLKPWFEEVNKLTSRKIAIFLICSLITGCRKNELLSLKWTDVDFRWKTAKVRDKIEDEGRLIPLTAYVESLLLELKKNSDSKFIFSSKGAECGHIVNPYDSLEKICKKLNIELTPHGLRRSYKTLAIWAKINEGSLAQISGHKPSALVERHYIVRPMDMLRETLQEYEDWILQQVRNGIN
jgi:integrase